MHWFIISTLSEDIHILCKSAREAFHLARMNGLRPLAVRPAPRD
jgi:hypothetical protein